MTDPTDDAAFTITETDEPVDVTVTKRRRRWPVITAALTAALMIGGGGGLIAYSHRAATQLQRDKDSLVQRHPRTETLPPALECERFGTNCPGHVWGTAPGEQQGGNLSDLQDGGGCPSHMVYPDGACVPETERKSRASEFIPDPASCESGVIVLNPVPRCETMREKVGDEFRRSIEQAQQENNPPLSHLDDALSPAERAATQG